jgi:acylphosphatase
MLTAGEANAQREAIAGTVSGEKIQKVGFRAMIQKQAIIYNLAGYARKLPGRNGEHRPAGDKDRIDKVLEAIRAGSKKSSRWPCRYPPMREKMSRKGAPPQAEVTKSL